LSYAKAFDRALELGVLFEETGGLPHVLLLFGLVPEKDAIGAGPQTLGESAHFLRRQLRRDAGADSFTFSHRRSLSTLVVRVGRGVFSTAVGPLRLYAGACEILMV
jgi:hypothetical protein